MSDGQHLSRCLRCGDNRQKFEYLAVSRKTTPEQLREKSQARAAEQKPGNAPVCEMRAKLEPMSKCTCGGEAPRPGTITLPLPRPPEGGEWLEAGETIVVKRRVTDGAVMFEFTLTPKLAPTHNKEESQAWAALQPPGTVAVKDGVEWHWLETTSQAGSVTAWILPSKKDGAHLLDADAWYYSAQWRGWDSRLSGIGPEHIEYRPRVIDDGRTDRNRQTDEGGA